METLQKELATYKGRLAELLKDEGKFVLIHGEEVLGAYGTYEDALTAGYKTVGVRPFLVKRISAFEPVNFSSRSYQPVS